MYLTDEAVIEELIKILIFFVYIGVIGFCTFLAKKYSPFFRYIESLGKAGGTYNKISWMVSALILSVALSVTFFGIQSTESLDVTSLFWLYVRYTVYYAVFLIALYIYYELDKITGSHIFHPIPPR